MIEIESHIQEQKEALNSIEEEVQNQEKLLKMKENRLEELNDSIDTTKKEYEEREERLWFFSLGKILNLNLDQWK